MLSQSFRGRTKHLGWGRSPHPQIPPLPPKDRNDIIHFHLDAVLGPLPCETDAYDSHPRHLERL